MITAALANQEQDQAKSLLGFWIYLMTDLLLFATLFATFVVLRGNNNSAEIFSLPYIFVETIVLLTSSYTAGIALYFSYKGHLKNSLIYLAITFLLGVIFITMELTEFALLAGEGYSWTTSGFMSAYYTLVGTHGLHIIIGLLWLGTLMYSLYKNGFNKINQKRFLLWSMFWHFLDIVWIFIFTVVYLMGAVK